MFYFFFTSMLYTDRNSYATVIGFSSFIHWTENTLKTQLCINKYMFHNYNYVISIQSKHQTYRLWKAEGGSIIFFYFKQSLTFTLFIVGRGQPMAYSTNYSFYLHNKFIYNFRNYPTNKKGSTFKKSLFHILKASCLM